MWIMLTSACGVKPETVIVQVENICALGSPMATNIHHNSLGDGTVIMFHDSSILVRETIDEIWGKINATEE